MLEIRKSPGKGRGVFAVAPIAEGECFERSAVIRIPGDELVHVRRTVIHNYFFKWGGEKKEGAIALGYGSLFNHSYEPNAGFRLEPEEETIVFTALRDILPGEEITINYNGDPDDRARLWFQALE